MGQKHEVTRRLGDLYLDADFDPQNPWAHHNTPTQRPAKTTISGAVIGYLGDLYSDTDRVGYEGHVSLADNRNGCWDTVTAGDDWQPREKILVEIPSQYAGDVGETALRDLELAA